MRVCVVTPSSTQFSETVLLSFPRDPFGQAEKSFSILLVERAEGSA